MRNALFVVVAGLIAGTVACGGRKDAGRAYVTGPSVPLYAAPSTNEPVLQVLARNSEAEILTDRIPDRVVGDRRYWYRVRVGDREGFISYDAALVQKALMTFHSVPEAQKGIVTASALRLRSAPGLTAPVITSVPRGGIVDVLMEGSFKVDIDDRSDTWLRLRLPDGREGFAFAGYVQRASAKNEAALAAYAKLEDVTTLEGHFCLKSDSPRYAGQPGSDEAPGSSDAAPCGGANQVSLLPTQAGACMTVDQRATTGGRTYYRVSVVSGGINYCDGGAVAWIADDQGDYTADLFNYELANVQEPERKAMLVAIAAANDGGVVRPHTAEFSDFTANDSSGDYRLAAVSLDRGYYSEKRKFLLRNVDGGWSVVAGFGAHRTVSHNGITYLISSEAARVEITYNIYASNGGGFQKIGSFSTLGQEPALDGPYLRFDNLPDNPDNTELFGDVFDARFNGRTQRTLFLDGMTVREIDANEARNI